MSAMRRQTASGVPLGRFQASDLAALALDLAHQEGAERSWTSGTEHFFWRNGLIVRVWEPLSPARPKQLLIEYSGQACLTARWPENGPAEIKSVGPGKWADELAPTPERPEDQPVVHQPPQRFSL